MGSFAKRKKLITILRVNFAALLAFHQNTYESTR
jgi:hypothetical protein